MKATVRKFVGFGWAAVLAAVSAFAEVVDVTDRLEYLFNPGHEHWGGHKLYEAARGVKTLAYLDGRIYVALGDYSNNLGPVPIVSIGVGGETPTFRTEYVAGTEQIDKFKKLSDGRIWAVSVDPRLGSGFSDVLMTKRDGEAWRPTSNVSNQPFLDKYHAQGGGRTRPYEHVWDFCDYKGTLFFGGYDIMKSETWLRGDEALANQAAGCTIMDNVFACVYDNERYAYMRVLARMVSLMPFDNGLVCWHLNTRYWKDGKIARDPQMWRYDEKTGLFTEENTTYDTFIPGWNAVDWELQTSQEQYLGNVGFDDIKKFAGRLFYVVQDGGMEFYSMGFYSATMDAAGNISAKKVVLDDGHDHVVRTCIVDGVMYCLAQHPWGEDGLMTQSLWKTTDGETFTKFAEFRANHACQAMTYANGWFYVGYGYHQKLATAEVVAESGKIFRFYLPQEPVALVADRTSVEVAEGGATNVFLRLSSAPKTNVTVRIALESDNHTFTLSPATLTFTPSNWNVAQEAAIGCPKPAEGDAPAGTLFLGTPGSPECTDLAIQVTPVKDAASQDDPAEQDDPQTPTGPDPVDPQTPTDPDPVDPPAISVHETEYLWSPAGGSGNWSEAANWRVAGSVAAECPSETDSVVFGSSDSEVVLSANCTISNLTISSVGKHVFRTTDVTQKYTLTCATSVSLSGAGGGTLVVEDIDMSGRKINDLAGLKQLVITGKGKVYPSTSPTTDIVLVNGGTLYNGGSDLEFKKLKLVGGPSLICFSQYTTKGVVFDSFEAVQGTGVPVVSVKDGRVSFTNTAGIETVGGTSTLASGASTIPVCPNFQIGSSKVNDRQHGRSACTIDNGVIKEIPAASMMDTLDGATELDNVHLGADYTLDHDVTVNALIFNKAKINLGGHVVTVRSGVFREGENGMWNTVISNGIVRLCRPNALGDSTNNTDVRCRVDFFTDDNTDSEKCMVAYNCEGGGWDTYAVYTNFTGTFAVPPSTAFGFKSEMRSPRAVVEMRGGAIRPSAHYIRANLGGISGTGSANYSNWRTLLWLGEIGVGDQDDFNTLEGRIVVANGGFIKPGYVDYDGGRRGCFSIPYVTPQGTLPKLNALEFRDGAKLKVTLRADGTCSWLDASQTQSAGTFLDVTLAGDLVLEEAGRVKSGNGPWIVLKTGKETAGFFANAGANGRGIKGYKVAYNVDLGDGTYGVQVTKKQSGFSVNLK